MKVELRVEGKVIVIEAEGFVSVRVVEGEAVQPNRKPVAVPPVGLPPVAALPTEQQATAPLAAPPQAPRVAVQAAPAASCDLLSRLVALRRELAVAQKVPPYVVFKDSTLHEMAEKLPQDLDAFGTISGVGRAKLEKYGELFLAVIKEAAA